LIGSTNFNSSLKWDICIAHEIFLTDVSYIILVSNIPRFRGTLPILCETTYLARKTSGNTTLNPSTKLEKTYIFDKAVHVHHTLWQNFRKIRSKPTFKKLLEIPNGIEQPQEVKNVRKTLMNKGCMIWEESKGFKNAQVKIRYKLLYHICFSPIIDTPSIPKWYSHWRKCLELRLKITLLQLVS